MPRPPRDQSKSARFLASRRAKPYMWVKYTTRRVTFPSYSCYAVQRRVAKRCHYQRIRFRSRYLPESHHRKRPNRKRGLEGEGARGRKRGEITTLRAYKYLTWNRGRRSSLLCMLQDVRGEDSLGAGSALLIPAGGRMGDESRRLPSIFTRTEAGSCGLKGNDWRLGLLAVLRMITS